MVGERLDALLGEESRGRLHLGARDPVDDAGVAGMLVGEEGEQLPAAAVVLVDDAIAQVRAVEAGDEEPRVPELEALDDLAPRRRVGGGGQGDPRHAGEAVGERREPQVLGAEVVPPLRHAVRLVDREERQRHPAEELEEALGQEPLGRDVEQVEVAGQEAALDARLVATVEARVQELGGDAELGERRDLVLHERDERRDDDAGAGAQDRRNLVAERLAAAGRQEDDGVPALDEGVDDRLLLAAELRIAEEPQENAARLRAQSRLPAGGALIRRPPGRSARAAPARPRRPESRRGCRDASRTRGDDRGSRAAAAEARRRPDSTVRSSPDRSDRRARRRASPPRRRGGAVRCRQRRWRALAGRAPRTRAARPGSWRSPCRPRRRRRGRRAPLRRVPSRRASECGAGRGARRAHRSARPARASSSSRRPDGRGSAARSTSAASSRSTRAASRSNGGSGNSRRPTASSPRAPSSARFLSMTCTTPAGSAWRSVSSSDESGSRRAGAAETDPARRAAGARPEARLPESLEVERDVGARRAELGHGARDRSRPEGAAGRNHHAGGDRRVARRASGRPAGCTAQTTS